VAGRAEEQLFLSKERAKEWPSSSA